MNVPKWILTYSIARVFSIIFIVVFAIPSFFVAISDLWTSEEKQMTILGFLFWTVVACISSWAKRNQYQKNKLSAQNELTTKSFQNSRIDSTTGVGMEMHVDEVRTDSPGFEAYLKSDDKRGYLEVRIEEDVIRLSCALPKEASIEEMKNFKKRLQLQIKDLRLRLKEINQTMASTRTRVTLNQIRGARSRGLSGFLNRINRISADSKLRPKQDFKECLQKCIIKLEQAAAQVDIMILEKQNGGQKAA